jgi:hypothetical protein
MVDTQTRNFKFVKPMTYNSWDGLSDTIYTSISKPTGSVYTAILKPT